MTNRYKHLTRPELEAIKADISKQRDAMRQAQFGITYTASFATLSISGVRRWLRDQEDEVDAAIARIDHTIRPLVQDIDVFSLAEIA
jgi:hypothetical protein